MRRAMLPVAMVLVVGLAGADALEGKIPDPNYYPKIGDRAVLYVLDKDDKPYDVWCADARVYFRDYVKCLIIKDYDGMRELDDSGRVLDLKPGTEILVLDIDACRIKVGDEEKERTYVEVRIMSGPHQGKKLYTPDYHVTRLVENPSHKRTHRLRRAKQRSGSKLSNRSARMRLPTSGPPRS